MAREAMDMTAESAAEATRADGGKGVSAAYWRDVERGYGGRRGQQVATRASDRALAAMARVVGVTPGQLTGAGRGGAARVLAESLRREDGTQGDAAPVVRLPTPAAPDDNPLRELLEMPGIGRYLNDAWTQVPANRDDDFLSDDDFERKLWRQLPFDVPNRVLVIAARRLRLSGESSQSGSAG